jgi:glycosyltransferase involved in cell wall biosynthesis
VVFTPYALRLLHRGRVDLLRGHSVRHTGPALLLARRLARSPVPVVLHHHHLDPRWSRLEAGIARQADAIITVSGHSRDALVSAGVPSDRIHVVREGVERPAIAPGGAEFWPDPTGLRLLYLGRLETRKRPEVAIDALRRVRAERGATLVVAGEGPMKAALTGRVTQAGLDGAVRFTGRVSNRDKWALYDSADLLLFPSRLEGFGLVVAEAQSRGVPVIAAHGTATSEAFEAGRTGLLAEATGDAFAGAVFELADAERRAVMSAAAREHSARFNWDGCAAEVAAVYKTVAAAAAGARQSRWS